MYKLFFKRFFDFWVALFCVLLSSPLLIVTTIWLHFANKKGSLTPAPSPKGKGNRIQRWLEPAIFLQERPGLHGKIFKIIKFKTMTDERDAEGNLLPDEVRLTKVGKIVRKTSLDELPQLINVLKGDMALIGPRPLLPQYLPLYSPEQARRHEVRPGISGWAQCHGRNGLSWTEKFKLDVWYVDHVSLMTDLKVIGITFKKLIKPEGINQAGQATMEAFNGRNSE
jgi:lipopolysaccharide/colanic/teichoic acid biosynthesis glycosyltransferase